MWIPYFKCIELSTSIHVSAKDVYSNKNIEFSMLCHVNTVYQMLFGPCVIQKNAVTVIEKISRKNKVTVKLCYAKDWIFKKINNLVANA